MDFIEFTREEENGEDREVFRSGHIVGSYPYYIIRTMPNGEQIRITLEKIAPPLDNA